MLNQSTLPVWRVRRALVAHLRKHRVSVIVGETGSGKSTLIPQILYEAGFCESKGQIVCTQPRRVAAVSVATRVANERKCELGGLVGYSVRFEETTSQFTRIKYATDGMVVRGALRNSALDGISVLLIDEAHERSLQTDVLLAIAKKALAENKRLSLIVMSATLDADSFATYLGNNVPVFQIEGKRQHEVEVFHLAQKRSDMLWACVLSVLQIHREEPDGGILVFLPGSADVEACVSNLKSIEPTTLHTIPLYAALSPLHQLAAFEPPPKGRRKVVVATNIAETSITLPDVRYVVDSGQCKQRECMLGGLECLRVVPISQASAWQRTGRAGRCGSGRCYRLFLEDDLMKRSVYTVPEVKRCSPTGLVLSIVAMGISNPKTFDFMDPPDPESLSYSMECLERIGAIEISSGDIMNCHLTALGRKMVTLPLDPIHSRALIIASSCREEMLTLVSLLSVDSVFTSSSSDGEDDARSIFSSSEGDHIMLLNIYRAWRGAKKSKSWCESKALNYKSLELACDIRRQLKALCVNLSLNITSCGANTSQLRRKLAQAYFLNAAELVPHERHYLTSFNRQKAHIHPSSCLFRSSPDCVIYNEVVLTSHKYMRIVSLVDSDWIKEFMSNVNVGS